MAVSLEHWTRVCPASHSSLRSPRPASSDLAPSSSFHCASSFRLPSASSRCRHDPKRRATIVMQFEAADGSPSGRTHLTVREDERDSSSPPQLDPSVTKPTLPTEKIKPVQLRIPCLLMRGGTSRGTYFLKQHLPQEREALNKVLLRVMGSPDARQVDGLGGATSTTSKVAILSRSREPGVDVDYTFAEVLVGRSYVDWEPTCGNLLAGVGPAAIEMGLVKKIGNPVTLVRIRATNNGALVEAVVQTPNYSVTYDGDAVIDGVPGTAAPITLNFMSVVGSKTGGKLLPTGQLRDTINGVEVTCIDVAMPLVIAKASSFGKTGYETVEELNTDGEFFREMETIRVIAGGKMGLGNVSGRVIPKFAIVAEARDMGNITARYFTPIKTHTAMAVTGAICIGCCSILQGSVVDDVSTKSCVGKNRNRVVIEHPSGQIQIFLDWEQEVGTMANMTVNKAGVMRTARLIFEGLVHIKAEGLGEFRFHHSPEGLDGFQHFHHQLQQDFRRLYRFKGLSDNLKFEWDGD